MPGKKNFITQKKDFALSELRQKRRELCRRYASQMTSVIRNDTSVKCGHLLIDDTTIGESPHRISKESFNYITNCYKQFLGEWRGLEKKCNYKPNSRVRNSRKKRKGPLQGMYEVMKTLEILRQSEMEMSNMLVPNQKEKNRRRIDTMLAKLDAV